MVSKLDGCRKRKVGSGLLLRRLRIQATSRLPEFVKATVGAAKIGPRLRFVAFDTSDKLNSRESNSRRASGADRPKAEERPA
jgi:hypothetical protein